MESSAETKILIAYFTGAENAVDTSRVDATTSASVQAPGNVARMAAWIQQETGVILSILVDTFHLVIFLFSKNNESIAERTDACCAVSMFGQEENDQQSNIYNNSNLYLAIKQTDLQSLDFGLTFGGSVQRPMHLSYIIYLNLVIFSKQAS